MLIQVIRNVPVTIPIIPKEMPEHWKGENHSAYAGHWYQSRSRGA